MEVVQVQSKGSFFSFLPGLEGEQILDPAEVAALIKFASEQGIEEGDLVPTLFRQLRLYEHAVQNEDIEAREQATEQMLSTYTKLTKVLGGINGRNLVHGRNLVWHTKTFMGFAFLFFIACISTLALGEWVQNEPISDDFFLSDVTVHYIKFFTPFLWGALGAFVYILKTITDVAAENRFDPDKFQGWLTRASLGAILGGIIVYVIDPSTFGEVTLNSTAIAFLTGLGTKVVYGGLQRLIQILADKMNLQSLKEPDRKKDVVTQFLAKEIANTDPDNQTEKYEFLTGLLDARAATRKSGA